MVHLDHISKMVLFVTTSHNLLDSTTLAYWIGSVKWFYLDPITELTRFNHPCLLEWLSKMVVFGPPSQILLDSTTLAYWSGSVKWLYLDHITDLTRFNHPCLLEWLSKMVLFGPHHSTDPCLLDSTTLAYWSGSVKWFYLDHIT